MIESIENKYETAHFQSVEHIRDQYTYLERITGEVDLGLYRVDLDVMEILEFSNLLKRGNPSKKLLKLLEQKAKIYPHKEGSKWSRTRSNRKKGLIRYSRDNLEKTLYTVDTDMTDLADKVFSEPVEYKGEKRTIKTSEMFVMTACARLIAEGNKPMFSEFGDDWRGRFYQLACHSPNGKLYAKAFF